MVNLYEYDKATLEECVDDLKQLLENLSIYDGSETLERKGLRLQYIAQRLQELGY